VSCSLVAGGCAAPDHPPVLGNTTDPGNGGIRPGASIGADAGSASGCPVWDGGLTNQCSAECTPLTGDLFNPGDVYFFGSLNRDAMLPNDYFAIAHWSNPNQACVGFDPHFNGASVSIGPTDGRFYYLDTNDTVLRQFREESCGSPTAASYPAYPLDNDVVVPTMQCGNSGIADFRFSPEGDLYYICSGGDGSWVSDKTGAKVFDGSGHMRRVGRNQIALVEYGTYGGLFYGGDFRIQNFATGTQTEVVWAGGKPMNLNPDATRASDNGGFWVGFKDDGGGAAELWEVGPDANGNKIGVYPPPPHIDDLFGANSQLDGCLGLVQWGHNVQAQSIVVRRDLKGDSEIGYNSSDGPLVQVGPSSPAMMITAP
jgi:hypothetical protein